ncbi:hypothetical protein QA612_02255 [Evansella sp. AB-P1]|uniref:hypothetical protein n=1 Tax=Evansella sp. AB-P1 TaxID=3037653 RepID=UPI00241DFD9C|nr:hypothetical protein [Evansella sp. AB-P1]MDG5786296.1 hypothetical protein [Evansella sp. AB-P1]
MTLITKKAQFISHWHHFWYMWHFAKFYYYGSSRHERKMEAHEQVKKEWLDGRKTEITLWTTIKKYFQIVKEKLNQN